MTHLPIRIAARIGAFLGSRSRTVRLVSLLIVAGGSLPVAALAQTLPPERAAKFDRGDRLSRAVIATMRCARSVARFREAGTFGPVDSLGGNGQCIAIDGKWVGVFFDADSAFTHVVRFSAVDFLTRSRRTAPLDTSAVLAVARAELDAQLRGMQPYQDAKRPYAPIAFRFDGDSIEVWMVPGAVLAGEPLTVGGERGYHYAPDGRTLVRRVDAFADFRTVALPDTGTIYIRSRGADVPTLTEFLVANLLNEQGRPVSIILPWGQSTLVGRGSQATWVQAVAR